jgi:hypothetical protein
MQPGLGMLWYLCHANGLSIVGQGWFYNISVLVGTDLPAGRQVRQCALPALHICPVWGKVCLRQYYVYLHYSAVKK